MEETERKPEPLAPWQQRVVDEADELTARIDRLREFMRSNDYMTLASVDQHILRYQKYHMQQYQRALLIRIENFDRARPHDQP